MLCVICFHRLSWKREIKNWYYESVAGPDCQERKDVLLGKGTGTACPSRGAPLFPASTSHRFQGVFWKELDLKNFTNPEGSREK